MGEGEGEDEPQIDENIVAEAEDALINGFEMSPTEHRAAKFRGCSATVVDPYWVLTARHCLPDDAQFPGTEKDKNPRGLKVSLDGETRDVTHVYLHPKHLQMVDVMMLRIASPFPNIPLDEHPISLGDTDDFVGEMALCVGYGGTGNQLTGGYFEVLEDSVYGNPNQFYQLEKPNADGQSHTEGDSGSACKIGGAIIGVHKGAGQVSAEAWADWAVDRRDCPAFDPNNPTTTFCSAACPCDVGEGDCDGNDQCLPGLRCADVGTDEGLPSSYAVCERINPASCGTFPADVGANFCRWDDSEICACSHGQGDCDQDHDCGGSLECQLNTGSAVGLPAHYAVCVYPAAPGCARYVPTTGTGNDAFCTEACPCDIGQGDCDNSNQCRGGLVCASNVGADFGLDPGADVCVAP
jgi:hypothetical protein